MAFENIQVRLNVLMIDYGPIDTLAQRAKAARKHAGLTQEQAVERSGVKQSDISKIERGKTLRSVGLLQLAQAYNCDPYWLDTGNGTPPWEQVQSSGPGIVMKTEKGMQALEVKAPRQARSFTVDESEWALLQDFALLPDDEKHTLRTRLAEKARAIRQKADEIFFGKHNIPAPVPDSRVAEAFGAAPAPAPTGAGSWKKITPVPDAPRPGRKKVVGDD